MRSQVKECLECLELDYMGRITPGLEPPTGGQPSRHCDSILLASELGE